ncbi:MAG: hypothetical protein LBE12_13080, partial [Planctomycetaceae bacterium]|nr:hypothetical protein [Planctomycetaceae bacterium]
IDHFQSTLIFSLIVRSGRIDWQEIVSRFIILPSWNNFFTTKFFTMFFIGNRNCFLQTLLSKNNGNR